MANQSASHLNFNQSENLSEAYSNFTQSEDVITDRVTFQTFWLVGIGVSTLCLFLQSSILLLIPNTRKYDEKVLFQMIVARLVNTFLEYMIVNIDLETGFLKDAVFSLYFQTDFALICWMFVFTKNLFDKVVLVFVWEKCSLLLVSLLIWILTIPVGAMAPLSMTHDWFDIYYKAFAHIKFFMLIINMLIFIEIFHVAYRIGMDKSRNIRHFVKTAVIAFILICITSLQVLMTDLLSYFVPEDKFFISEIFCVVNSYQTLAITIIFLILARKKLSDSLILTVYFKLKNILCSDT